MPISTGTIASNADDGNQSSSRAPMMLPISEASAVADDPCPLPDQIRPAGQRGRQRSRRQPDAVGDVGHDRRDAQRQQGREGDQGAGADHGVDQTGRRPPPTRRAAAPTSSPAAENRSGSLDSGPRLGRPASAPERRTAGAGWSPVPMPRISAGRRSASDASLRAGRCAPAPAPRRSPPGRSARTRRRPPRPAGSISAWTSTFSGAVNLPLSRADVASEPPNASVSDPTAPPSPSRALPISLGTIQTLLASPRAMVGSICMYW